MKKDKNSLIKKDLLPIRYEQRKIGPLGYFFVWIGLSVIIATFAVGGEGVASMPLGWVVFSCLIANIFLGLFITLTGDVGIEHGISFPVYLRAIFGPIGTHIPSLLRALYGTVWFGVQTYFGALAINYIMLQFISFDNWFFWYLVFATIQIINTAFGFKAIERFATIAAPSIIIISIYLYIRIEGIASDKGIDIWNTLVGDGEYNGFVLNTFLFLFFINMAYWASSSSDAQNLTREVIAPQYETNWFKRNKNALMGHMIALPLTQTFMILIGGLSMIALGNWNPVEAIQTTSSGLVLIILMLLVVFAQWSTNASGNLLPPALIFVNSFKVNYVWGVIISGFIATITQPWVIMDNLQVFLTIVSTFFASFAGITFTDYYILRKRRLNVPDLYKNDGQYNYFKGWNLAGIIAIIVGLFIGLQLSTYAFIIGFFASGITYYFLAKYWVFKKYKQAEIEENFSNKYLGITQGRDWVLNENNEIVESISPKNLNDIKGA